MDIAEKIRRTLLKDFLEEIWANLLVFIHIKYMDNDRKFFYSYTQNHDAKNSTIIADMKKSRKVFRFYIYATSLFSQYLFSIFLILREKMSLTVVLWEKEKKNHKFACIHVNMCQTTFLFFHMRSNGLCVW